MNKIFLIFILLFPLSSFAQWTWIAESTDNTNYYVDVKRMKKLDGYIYFWELMDLSKPSPLGTLSAQSFRQVDCKLLRSKTLTISLYTKPMGAGTISKSYDTPDKEWKYSLPQTIGESLLKTVCIY